MKYNLFLFDLDDTLLDFKATERLAFFSTMKSLGLEKNLDEMFQSYKVENHHLWKLFEEGKVEKSFLKVERFRKTFENFNLTYDASSTAHHYLEQLSSNIVLIEGAVELCQWLHDRGEIGIITNGNQNVQTMRIKNSQLAPYISFLSVSEACGFAKPDLRFFEYSIKMAKNFSRPSTLVIGDRLETDILGAPRFGVDSCWFNPGYKENDKGIKATYQISSLGDLKKILE